MQKICVFVENLRSFNLRRMLRLKIQLFLLVFMVFSFIEASLYNDEGYCEKSLDSKNHDCSPVNRYSKKKYILYDVNPSEGFNLRRDVYVRIAPFIRTLNEMDKDYEWNLVLPPWERMYHWRSQDLGSQSQLPWGIFFDIPSLRRYAPVIEMHEFFRDYESERNFKGLSLDIVYVLQNDPKMFETGKFEDKIELIECTKERLGYRMIENNVFSGHFWGYSNLTAQEVACVVFHGTASDISKLIKSRNYRSIMLDHMEIPLHDEYGSREYWKARRSMRYNNELYDIANEFRQEYLESTDTRDNTVRPLDWTEEKGRRNAIGGPYVAVHLRRRDFLNGRPKTVPTIPGAAEQLNEIMKKHKLEIIFVATDATENEYEELKNLLSKYRVHRYVPSRRIKEKFKDGGIAIIDQIICSHARYFVGTHESTFTFRIQEDREIMGFPVKTTFNRLCGREKKCSRGGQWEIVW